MHRELPLQQRLDAHRAQRVNGRLRDDHPNQHERHMFRFGRNKATEISRWQRSQALSMTADIHAGTRIQPIADNGPDYSFNP
jgi:hypothetical protein